MWIIGLIVLIGVALLIDYLRRKARKAFTQGVLDRGGHAQGKAATTETIEFTAPYSAAQVIQSITGTLALPSELPGAFVARLILQKSDETSAVFVYGNRAVQTFRSVLSSADLPDGRSSSTYTVLNWRESDGIVQGIAEMKMLENTIRSCAAQLGATYGEPTEVEVPAAVEEPASFCTTCGSRQVGTRFCTDCGSALTAA